MALQAGYQGSIFAMTNASSVTMTNEALTDSGDHTTFADGNSAHIYWDDSATPIVQTEVDDIQTVTISGGPTGGTFTLTFGANTTAGIAYNAAASAVQTALVALASIGANNVSVSGPVGGPWIVEFTGTLGYAAQTLMTANSSGLTGGASPAATPTHTQVGFTWTNANASTYTVQYVGGKIIFNSALSGTPACRLSSGGKYFAYSTLAQGTDWEFDGMRDFVDISVMGGGRGKQWKPTLISGTFQIKLFYVDQTFFTNITTGLRYIMSGVTPNGKRFESYMLTKDDKIHDALAGVIEEQTSFQVTGLWYMN